MGTGAEIREAGAAQPCGDDEGWGCDGHVLSSRFSRWLAGCGAAGAAVTRPLPALCATGSAGCSPRRRARAG